MEDMITIVYHKIKIMVCFFISHLYKIDRQVIELK